MIYKRLLQTSIMLVTLFQVFLISITTSFLANVFLPIYFASGLVALVFWCGIFFTYWAAGKEPNLFWEDEPVVTNNNAQTILDNLANSIKDQNDTIERISIRSNNMALRAQRMAQLLADIKDNPMTPNWIKDMIAEETDEQLKRMNQMEQDIDDYNKRG